MNDLFVVIYNFYRMKSFAQLCSRLNEACDPFQQFYIGAYDLFDAWPGCLDYNLFTALKGRLVNLSYRCGGEWFIIETTEN